MLLIDLYNNYRKSADSPYLAVQHLIQEETRVLFGECGVVLTDILRVDNIGDHYQVLLRVPVHCLRKLRAALTLSTKVIRVQSEAPSLQALV